MKANSFWESLSYALEGLISTVKTQKNMKIHFILAFLVLAGSLSLELSRFELLVLFFAVCFVIAMELINTSVEIIVDMISEEYSIRARIAKNIAAGAVFMAAVNAVVTGYLIFEKRLESLSLRMLPLIRQQSFHLLFITLGLLFIIIIFMKAWLQEGTPLKGGMPSGHSAIAFAIVTMVVFLTSNFIVIVLVLLMALLVAQSRLESEIHNLLEVFMGALIGIMLTLIVFQLL